MKKFNLSKVKLIVYDFDGVMTDNKVYVDQNGSETVQVNRGDGLGVSEIKKMSIEQIIISTEKNLVVSIRAGKLGLYCLQGIGNKKVALLDYCYKKNIDFDLFDAAANFPISTAYTWRHTNWRNEQTTEGLWPFYRRYLAKEGIKSSDIKNSVLRQALLNQGDMETFPKSLEISCGNCNIYNVSAFKDPQFKKWIDAVDRYGGHYKHRWGDIEVLALYTATMYAHPIHDFNLVGRGLYRPQLPGTKLAPSISIWKLGVIRMLRNILRVFTYYPLRYLHNQLRPLFYRAVHRVRTVVSRLFVGNQGR